MNQFKGWNKVRIVLLFLTVGAAVSSAQTFTTLLNFGTTSGVYPRGPLVQGADGNLYGMTYGGGACCGTVFKTDLAGNLTTIYSFCSTGDCSGGTIPTWLILATDGNFYGTAGNGGIANNGTVFKLTPDGQSTTLHQFDWVDGAVPTGLIEADDGHLYGTTGAGGKSRYCPDCGTLFKISDGKLTTLFDFCVHPNCEGDGGDPGPLVQGSDGALYDTLAEGGRSGSIFRITRSGKYSTLFDFIPSEGRNPYGGLIQSGSSFYGTACYGGKYSRGTVFSVAPGVFTRLHSFISKTQGFCPVGKLLQASDGNFYGTTTMDGVNGGGTIFRITPDGTLTILHSFDGYDGSDPIGPLFQATNGIIYGTTVEGGAGGWGTLFSLDMGLDPFVAFVRDSGSVGATGGILGQGFTGTTAVSLNGTPATFTVVSDTFIRATVPAGATSGYVTVTTPEGTLTSNVPFRVIP